MSAVLRIQLDTCVIVLTSAKGSNDKSTSKARHTAGVSGLYIYAVKGAKPNFSQLWPP